TKYPQTMATPPPKETPTPTTEASPTPTPTPTPSATPSATPTGTPLPTPTPTFEGNFVIGDVEAVVGNHVYFWGSQWAQHNSLSGGEASPTPTPGVSPTPVNAFKGFANSTSSNPPDCGGSW